MEKSSEKDMNKCDVAIAYRIYPGVSKVPPIYSDDKYKLSELCLKSLKLSLSSLKVKIWALLDNCPKEYEDLFKKYFNEDELVVINLPGIGNNGTFSKQAEILLGQNDSEIVYFAEDDYFYLPGTFNEMTALFEETGLTDFATPYDHLDYYELPLHKYKSEIIARAGRKWKTVSTTCMTFMTTKKILAETKEIFMSYSRRNDDASLWLSLTKMKIFSPFLYVKFLFTSAPMFKILGKAWYFCAGQIIAGKRRKLLAPVPSIATHMDDLHLAPGIDWQHKFEEI